MDNKRKTKGGIKPLPEEAHTKLVKIQGHFIQCSGMHISLTQTVIKLINRFNIEENDCKDN